MTATLTPAGKALLTQIGQKRFSFFDDGIVENSGIWEMCLADESTGVAANAKGVALVIRKLVRDGYLEISNHDDGYDGPWVYLTALGATTAVELAAKDKAIRDETAAMNAAEDAEVSAQMAAIVTQRSYEAGTSTKAEAEVAWEAAFAADDNKENTVTTIADITPGQDFDYNGEQLRMVKVNATSFRAETPSGEVKSFKAKSSRKITAETPAETPGSVETTVTQKWQGKVRETKTIVTILDQGKGNPERWVMVCEDHSQRSVAASSAAAWSESAHPLLWCPTCKVL